MLNLTLDRFARNLTCMFWKFKKKFFFLIISYRFILIIQNIIQCYYIFLVFLTKDWFHIGRMIHVSRPPRIDSFLSVFVSVAKTSQASSDWIGGNQKGQYSENTLDLMEHLKFPWPSSQHVLVIQNHFAIPFSIISRISFNARLCCINYYRHHSLGWFS